MCVGRKAVAGHLEALAKFNFYKNAKGGHVARADASAESTFRNAFFKIYKD